MYMQALCCIASQGLAVLTQSHLTSRYSGEFNGTFYGAHHRFFWEGGEGGAPSCILGIHYFFGEVGFPLY